MSDPPPAGRPRVLFLAFYFPPTRASGVFRSRAVANHLVRAGWDVTVVTPPREFFTRHIRSVDPSLEATVDPDVQVERVEFPPGGLTRDLRAFPWSRAMFPRIDARVRDAWRRRTFPDPYAAWIPKVVDAGRRLHRQRPFDLVLATGNPFASFGAAARLGRELGVPYVLDYRDSWTLDQFAEQPAFPPDHPAWDAEAEVVSGAARVVFVNPAQRDWHADRYPDAADRMLVVENGFDADLLGEALTRAPSPAEGSVRFGYIGTITRHLPVDAFVAGWREARSRPGFQPATATLYGYLGFFRHTADALGDELPFDDAIGIAYGGPLAKEEVGPTFASLDVLLLITPSSRFVTCQKVSEYMAFGKPIVSVNEPGTHAREPLVDYPLSFAPTDLSPGALADALTAAAAAARALDGRTVEEARRVAAAHSRDAHLAGLERELRQVVSA